MIVDLPELREKECVFKSRSDAGIVLSEMLADYKESDSIVLGIPAGGVSVAAVLAERLNLPLELAVVSKITLPWNTEAGFGAVAFDGTVRLNEQMLAYIGLTEEQINERIKYTSKKVQHRLKKLRGDKKLPSISEKTVFLVDDGIASGFTFRAAVEAVKNQKPKEIIIAVPTAHKQSLTILEKYVNTIYCANVRSGLSFAVADAYQKWYDVSEEEVLKILKLSGRNNINE
jgi:putative phosphoribosyl transferase